MGLIKRMIAGRIERLEESISLFEEIAGEEAIDMADAASFDPGPEAERLRKGVKYTRTRLLDRFVRPL